MKLFPKSQNNYLSTIQFTNGLGPTACGSTVKTAKYIGLPATTAICMIGHTLGTQSQRFIASTGNLSFKCRLCTQNVKEYRSTLCPIKKHTKELAKSSI